MSAVSVAGSRVRMALILSLAVSSASQLMDRAARDCPEFSPVV
jgi:hypothetical protein